MNNCENKMSEMKRSLKRAARFGSAVFLGAVCIGAAAQPAWLFAAETEKDKTTLSTKSVEASSKSQIQSAATSSVVSFEKFIEGMRCNGCGKHCLLTALKCPMGEDALKKAKEEYQKIKNNKSTAEVTITVPEAEISSSLADLLNIAPLGGLAVGGVYIALDRFSPSREKENS